jgi:hypothetical protein
VSDGIVNLNGQRNWPACNCAGPGATEGVTGGAEATGVAAGGVAGVLIGALVQPSVPIATMTAR